MAGKLRTAVRRIRRSNNNRDEGFLDGQDNQAVRLSTYGDNTEPENRKPCIDAKISNRFKKKTCVRYDKKNEKTDKCKCGRGADEHKTPISVPDEVDGKQNLIDKPWSKQDHLVHKPTNACGVVEFCGHVRKSQAKYIRVADDTDSSDAFSFLLGEWELKPPKLLISVTGGAKNFRLEQKLRSLFHHGLLKVARTSGAWVITGGTNTGVMKHVGKALQGASQEKYGKGRLGRGRNRVYCIGIATWGIIDHRKSLVNYEELVPYQMTSSMESSGACLDNNHTHFMLIDDGTVREYGKEINFRARLEKEIMKWGTGVPAVLLVVEGGPNTVRTIYEAITNDPPMPVVVIKDSGRAADLLAFAYDLLHREGQLLDLGDVVEHKQLMIRIQQVNPGLKESDYADIYQNIINVVKMRDFVTIFRMEEGSADLDHAILNALLKSKSTSKVEQLKLALAWNRADIARTQIFTDDKKWQAEDLENAMMIALKSDRVDFVDLFREHGVDLDQFLTSERLTTLYNERATLGFSMMKHMFDVKNPITLDDVDKALVQLLGDSMENRYKDMSKSFLKRRRVRSHWCRNAIHELFIWSVVCNMRDMAMCFWKIGEEALAKALVGCKMFQSMKSLGDRKNIQEDLINSVDKNMRDFQAIAIQLLDECCRVDEHFAAKLLTYKLGNWGSNTCLSWAVAAEFEEFVAHGSCQALLTDMWDGAMSIKTHQSLKTFLAIICPPLLLTFNFATLRERENMPTTEEVHKEAERESVYENMQHKTSVNCQGTNTNGVAAVSIDEDDKLANSYGRGQFPHDRRRQQSMSREGSDLAWYEKVKEFYKAPITKFWSNVLVYLVFLVLFAYVALVKLPPKPSVAEWVLIAFVISLTTEELRQLLQSDAENLYKKIWEWGSSKWNICDAIAIILFFVGLALRFVDDTRHAGQVVYSLDVMLWVVRLLDIFSVNKYLGPYVVMIGRMTADMMYFLFIMAVFLLAYGIARQAILEPHHSASWKMIGQVLFAPYFQVYGELFIEREAEGGKTIYGSPQLNDYAETLVTLIMAFYLLVANILLLNLLIAIFNHTYDEVQANSTQIWKFQRYHLIMEYSTRPFLIPPFIIINHIILVIRWLWKCCRAKRHKKQTRKLKFDPKPHQLRFIMMFEEDCVASYIRAKNSLQLAGQEEKLRLMTERVDKIGSMVADVGREGFSREKDFKKAIQRIENKVDMLTRMTTSLADDKMSAHDELDEDLSGKFLPAVQLKRQHFTGRQHSLTNERLLSNLPHKVSSPTASLPPSSKLQSGPRSPVRSAARTFRRLSSSGPIHEEAHRVISSEGEQRKKDYQKPGTMRSMELDDPPFKSEDDETNERRRCVSCPSRHVLHEQRGQRPKIVSPEEVFITTEHETPEPISLKRLVHQRSRESPYPGSDVTRFPVADFMVHWEVCFPSYAPMTYTEVKIDENEETDPTTLSGNELHFNDLDAEIDRRSNVGLYKVVDGYPRNPMGRTGLKGRGNLSRWGPNHVIYCLITRWKRDPEGEVLNSGDLPVLEFFAVNTKKGYGIPQSPMGAQFLPQSESFDMGKEAKASQFFEEGEEIFKGYLDNQRNTDNAWIETSVLNFHDADGCHVKYLQVSDAEMAWKYSWQDMTTKTSLYSPHQEYLRITAQVKSAAFEIGFP